MESKKTTITVNIFGGEYNLKADTDSDYMKNVAKYVDERMKEVAEKFSLGSPIKVAILAAVNIADELFQERKARQDLLSYIENKSATIIEKIENELIEKDKDTEKRN